MKNVLPRKMEVTIKTLTPLWTGGVDAGKCDRIHETGILGSLRWWMEVLVRGVGGNACDPTEQKCSYKNGLCEVCKIFGAEGQKRRFRLSVIEKKLDWQPSVPLKITPSDRTRGWFLNPGWLGTVKLTLQGDSETLAKLHALLYFLESWGSLGARPQLGYGAFRILNIEDVPPLSTYEVYGNEPLKDQPDLRTFTFFKLRFTTKTATWWHSVPGIRELRGKREWSELENLAKRGMVPTTPALKNYLRYHHQWSSPALPHWLFGTIRQGDDRIRGRVAFSWAYRLDNSDEWEIRGWMYLPQDNNGRTFQREILNTFKDKLGQPQAWLKALGLQDSDYRAAKLILQPTQNPWQTHSIPEVQAFLQNPLTREQP